MLNLPIGLIWQVAHQIESFFYPHLMENLTRNMQWGSLAFWLLQPLYKVQLESDAWGHLKELCKVGVIYIHRQRERPNALLHSKNNDPP